MRVINTVLCSSVLLVASTAAAQPAAPTLVLPVCADFQMAVGERKCMEVLLEGRGASVASVGFKLAYDPAVLRLPGGDGDAQGGSALTGGQSFTAVVDEEVATGKGEVQVVITPPIKLPIPVIPDGVIGEICFTAVAPGGCTLLGFVPGSISIGDDGGKDLPVDPPSDGGAQVGPDGDCQPCWSGGADGGDEGLSDAAAAKAVVKCQAVMKRAFGGFATRKHVRLQRCVDEVFECVQREPGDAKCLERARRKCEEGLAKIEQGPRSDLARARAKVLKACRARKAGQPPSVADLLSVSGIGYEAEAQQCAGFGVAPLDSLDAIIECVGKQHECWVERLLSKEVPRARELLELVGVDVGQFACLGAGADGGGQGLVDTAAAKAAVKCQAAIKKAGGVFVKNKLARLQGCVDAVFQCVQKRPGDAKCLAKAGKTCAKADERIHGEGKSDEVKLVGAIGRGCEELTSGGVLDLAGLGFEVHEQQCQGLGVAQLGDIGDVAQCILCQHECLVEGMLEKEVPRAKELLDLGVLSTGP